MAVITTAAATATASPCMLPAVLYTVFFVTGRGLQWRLLGFRVRLTRFRFSAMCWSCFKRVHSRLEAAQSTFYAGKLGHERIGKSSNLSAECMERLEFGSSQQQSSVSLSRWHFLLSGRRSVPLADLRCLWHRCNRSVAKCRPDLPWGCCSLLNRCASRGDSSRRLRTHQ